MAGRVVHVVESLTPQAGSLGVVLPGLFAALSDLGIEQDVILLTPGQRSGVGGQRSGFDPDRTLDKPGSANKLRLRAFGPGSAADLIRDTDLVHVHGWGGVATASRGSRYEVSARRISAIARRERTPLILSPCGGLTQSRYHLRGWLERLRGWLGDRPAARRASLVTALNALEERELRARFPSAQVRALPYGLDFGAYDANRHETSPNPESDAERCLLVLGPVHPAEGCVPLLRALHEIGPQAGDWKLVMAGPQVGAWGKVVGAAIRRKGEADRVAFAETPDSNAQREWLARASVLVCANLEVCCPVSLLQGIASGVPVVASDRIVPPGLDGAVRVCPPRREALRDALDTMLRLSDAERVEIGRKARETARHRFDWPLLAKQYVELYESYR